MTLPKEIKEILKKLADAGFEAYAVGGCVRDLLLKRKPQDWDITTNASPEEIQKIFPEHFYENAFGTVTVKTPHQADPLTTKRGGGLGAGQAGAEDISLKEVQITPYRIEGKYSDKRHPDEIRFADKLADDLSRRDFTVNALAIGNDGKVTDLFEGQKDLKAKLIRTVGEPEKRFGEDALRLLRAVRFAVTLGFEIQEDTLAAVKQNAGWLRAISKERIRDEFVKIIESDNAYAGVNLLLTTGLMEHIVSELLEGVGMDQNLHHIYTVWEHNVRALKYTAEKKYSLPVRLSALLHDVGKPQTKRGEGRNCTFYGHDVIGAKLTAQIMERLKFSREMTEKVYKLVRFHMFYYNTGEVTASSVRRLLANVGPENMDDLLKLREADRIGSGTPKAVPYKLRHLKYMIEKVQNDPISVKMLKLNGGDLMQTLGIAPGPKIGLLLNSLLADVLDDPAKNTREYLEQRARELSGRSDDELRQALKKIEEAREKEDQEMMKKYYV